MGSNLQNKLAAGEVIPPFTFPPAAPKPAPSGHPSRDTLDKSAANKPRLQISVAASGELERICYGRVHIGAQIGFPIVYATDLYVPCFLCLGEVDAIEAIDIDNKDAPTGVTRTDYVGTDGQAVNATLVTAWAAKSRTYTDTYPGIAYSVVRFPLGPEYGFSNIAFTVRGKKVYDPRLAGSPGGHVYGNRATYAYSNNPALCLADLIDSAEYGMGQAVDWDSFATLADYCDELVGTPPNTEKRRTIGIVLDRQQKTEQWVETLRSYAGCFLTKSNGLMKAVPDRPASVVMALDSTDYRLDSITVSQVGPENAPTVVQVKYADTQSLPWDMDATCAFVMGSAARANPQRSPPARDGRPIP